MFTVYGDKISGNCLKVKYVADLLGIEYQWIETGVLSGETRNSEFLEINPAGQVPVLIGPEGRALAQSNAIMLYLAGGSALIPADLWQKAKMNEWLFWEQYSHETAIAVARFQVVYKGKTFAELAPELVVKGDAALNYMEGHLKAHEWFVGSAPSLADIALFAYTQFAPDAGFDLECRPNIRRWLYQTASVLDLGSD